MDRLVALASGVHPGLPPAEMARVAGEAGFNAVGLWIEPGANWHRDTTAQVLGIVEQYDMAVVDVEVLWLKPDTPFDLLQRILEIGGELGARNALIISSFPDLTDTKQAFARLCDIGARCGVRTCLEFMPITEVKTLQHALEVVRDVDHPNAGILLDSHHLDRTGAHPHDIRGLDPQLFPYAQVNDAPASKVITELDEYLEDALDGRLAPGEGALPCAELLAVLPKDIPISLEVRSKYYRNTYPDPLERARQIRTRTYDFLARL